MSTQLHGRTLDVWDRAATQTNARIQEATLCLSSGELTRSELALIAGDVILVGTFEDATEAPAESYASTVVYASGLDLADKLLSMNALDGASRIHWHLEMALIETLETLSRLHLPFDVRVEGINHTDSGVVVTTSLTAGGAFDAQSYRRGVEAGMADAPTRAHTGQPSRDALAQRETRTLQEKLLRTLQTIEPLIDDTPNCDRLHDERAEGELVRLRRKYDDLERKYKMLANSRLGKVTLKMWARKRRHTSPQTAQ